LSIVHIHVSLGVYLLLLTTTSTILESCLVSLATVSAAECATWSYLMQRMESSLESSEKS